MRLLLDEHVPPAIERGLQDRGVDVVAIPNWQDGTLRSTPDHNILVTAAAQRRVLVSFDVNTIPPLIDLWAARGMHHAGVILISRKTFRQDDVGGILRALQAIVAERGDEDWQDQMAFL
ncbi:MAG: DUF5615 family PIN-like protein [Chloroflexota bacterium]|nr:DUF5615 family PIN-like protein [Chloroflexota bacterium]